MNRIEIEIQYEYNDVPLIKLQTKYPGRRVLKRTNTEKHVYSNFISTVSFLQCIRTLGPIQTSKASIHILLF